MNPEVEALLRRIATPDNWGYFDESGCPKGAGAYTDSWIGDEPHPMVEAARLLASK